MDGDMEERRENSMQEAGTKNKACGGGREGDRSQACGKKDGEL